MARLTSDLIISLIDRVTAPARAIERRMTSLRRASEANARAIGATSTQMIGAVGAAYALSRAISAPVTAAMAFESAMADVRKVVDFETPAQFQQMSKDILAMSTRIPMAADGLASIVAAAGQAGMAGKELLSFTEMAAKVGVAFDLPAARVGEDLAKIKTALGLTVAETGVLADAMNHLSNTSASAAPDLIDFMKRVGSAGESYGFTAREVAAIGSAMIAAGAEANVAATSFRNMGRALAKGESASKRQVAAFKRLGLSAKQVSIDLQRDAVGTMNDVIARIRKLPEHLQATTMSELFGDEARALMPLIENAELLDKSLAAVADSTAFLGSVQEEYNRRADTTENTLQLLRNKMNVLGITIGSVLLPAINQIADAVGPWIGKLTELAEAHPQAVTAVIGLVGGLVALRIATIAASWGFLFLKGGVINTALAVVRGSALMLAGLVRVRGAIRALQAAVIGAKMLSLVGGGGFLSTLATGLPGISGVIVTAATGIAGAIAAISAPVWGVIAAVAALGLAVYRFWEPISNFVIGFASGIVNALGPVRTAIGEVFSSITTAVGEWTTDKLVDFGTWLGFDEAEIRAAIDVAYNAVSGSFTKLINFISGLPGRISKILSNLFSMKDYSDESEKEFRDAGRRAADALIEWFEKIPERIGKIVDEIVAWFAGLPGRIRDVLTNIDLGDFITLPDLSGWNPFAGDEAATAANDNAPTGPLANPAAINRALELSRRIAELNAQKSMWSPFGFSGLDDEQTARLARLSEEYTELYRGLPQVAQEGMVAYAKALAGSGGVATDQATEIANQLMATLNITLTPVIDSSGVDVMINKVSVLDRKMRALPGVRASAPSPAVAGARAAGGGVTAGLTYLVGEEGPELVTFAADGYVHSAAATSAIFDRSAGIAIAPPSRPAEAIGSGPGGAASATSDRSVTVGDFHFGDIIVQNRVNSSPRQIADSVGDETARRVREAFADGGI